MVEIFSTSDPDVVYKATTDAAGDFEFKEVLADMYKVLLTDTDGNRVDTKEFISVVNTAIISVKITATPKEIVVESDTTVQRNNCY